ncbi:hypothetical protein [Anaerococcus hydrogenalis]|uniref:Conserved domain protein n=1 Tax=Anaerococcus hydrogenalis ACS-025-V-Sch4 TaxID=879306 RepID=F0H299_9FIRM|nr:hypothetical protein [Anaerococcus hydrogenalis]EGC83381.1 conserved domain protein [Anaerococcus hydrogenalis ACS-025-V-Sch4]
MNKDKDLKGNIKDIIDNLEKDYDHDNENGRSYSHEEIFYSMGRFINIMRKLYGNKLKSPEMTFTHNLILGRDYEKISSDYYNLFFRYNRFIKSERTAKVFLIANSLIEEGKVTSEDIRFYLLGLRK